MGKQSNMAILASFWVMLKWFNGLHMLNNVRWDQGTVVAVKKGRAFWISHSYRNLEKDARKIVKNGDSLTVVFL